jgi:hypothetical protein
VAAVSVRARFDVLAAAEDSGVADLDALWAHLAPATVQGMLGGGLASLWDVAFRGEVTATMVYDALPVLDHFKVVDDRTVMGIMNGKLEPVFGTADPYYFWLERD